MSDPPPPPPRNTGSGMMSGLYANLLGSSSAASISAAPIVFNQGSTATDAAAAQKKTQINPAALRFQPTIHKRPVLNTKPKLKSHISLAPGAAGANAGTSSAGAAEKTTTTTGAAVIEPPKIIAKTTLDDWMDDGNGEDVNGFYAGKRAGVRKKRKKNRATPPPPTNWDDPYDPGRPNNYEEYREGEEKVREMAEWREKLFGKRRRGSESSESSSDGERRGGLGMGGRFAPPKSYSFAPPSSLSGPPPPPPPPPPATDAPPVNIPDDVSGEDAFARRMRMSQQGAVGYSSFDQPPPPPPTEPPQSPPPPSSATISAAPVRYNNPSPQPPPSPPVPRRSPSPPSTRPGQKDFARRLLESQGWKSGQGLGRSGDGITKAITMVSVSKKGKGKPGHGRIIDKNKPRANPASEERSEVVELTGVVDGHRGEMEDAELMQLIGDVWGRYGRVVQIVVCWMEDEEEEEVKGERAKVYVLYADVGSAVMAVSGGRRKEVFEGNTTNVRFFDRKKFEERDFEDVGT